MKMGGAQGLFQFSVVGSFGNKSSSQYSGYYPTNNIGFTNNFRFVFTGLSGPSQVFTLSSGNINSSEYDDGWTGLTGTALDYIFIYCIDPTNPTLSLTSS